MARVLCIFQVSLGLYSLAFMYPPLLGNTRECMCYYVPKQVVLIGKKGNYWCYSLSLYLYLVFYAPNALF